MHELHSFFETLVNLKGCSYGSFIHLSGSIGLCYPDGGIISY